MSRNPLIEGLSREQYAAATFTSEPVMTLAGAGSGKTRMLMGRFAHLVAPREQGGLQADPDSIMMVTFTNKAAAEMRDRIAEPLKQMRAADPGFPSGDPWIGTFHGLSLRILRIEAARAGLGKDFSIFDESDAKSVLDDVTDEMKLEQFDADEFFRDLETAKARMFSPEFLQKGLRAAQGMGPTAERWKRALQHFKSERFFDVYARYQAALRDQNAVDFNDLLNRTTRLFQEHPDVRLSWQSSFRHFMVDEVQDINRAQVSWLTAITGGGAETVVPADVQTEGPHRVNTYRIRNQSRPTVCVVGDDDQSIYAFRGSEPAIMRSLEDRFPGLERRFLNTSYRCAPSILEAANKLVAVNTDRIGKDLVAAPGTARLTPVRFQKKPTPDAEVAAIAGEAAAYIASGGEPGEFAVLTRTRDHAKQVAKALRASALPVVEGKSSDIRKTAEVKDAMAFVNVLTNAQAEVPLRRIANRPSRGLGNMSMQKVRSNAHLRGVTFLDEFRAVMRGQVDIPENGKPYPKKFITAAKQFGALIEAARASADAAPDAGSAITAVLRETGYLDAMYHDALKSAGRLGDQAAARQLWPREFLTWLVAAEQSDRDEACEDLNGEDLADRAGQISDAARRIGNIAILVAEAEAFPSLAAFAQESVLEMGQQTAPSGIQVLTMHAAKGLEFDHVRLPFWIEGVLPHGRAMEEGGEAIQEERRLAYVSLTRARQSVSVTAPRGTKGSFIRQRMAIQSPFIAEMSGAGCDVEFLPMEHGGEHLFADAAALKREADAERADRVALPETPDITPVPEHATDLAPHVSISLEELEAQAWDDPGPVPEARDDIREDRDLGDPVPF